MVKALYIFSFLMMVHSNSFSQSSINDYKYVIVPAQFEFLKEKDQYQINSLTEFLFNKYGYTAFLEDEELPQDLRSNPCLGLNVDVIEESGFLKVKLRIDLKDCRGMVVQSSKIGETREKSYEKAYKLALRDAFSTFQNIDYAYQPKDAILAQGSSSNKLVNSKDEKEIARLKEELKLLKEEKTETTDVKTPQPIEKVEDKEINTKSTDNSGNVIIDAKNSTELWYAQAIENGFQIVDSIPKVVMILHNTGVKDVFTVQGTKAIVYKKEGVWIYSEDGSILSGRPIQIKF